MDNKQLLFVGHKTLKMKDICRLEKGKQIDTDRLDNSNPYKYINGGIEASGYYNDYNTTGQTITVSEGGASCGYVNYVEEPFWCGCHCYRLTDIKTNPKYLYYAIKANQRRIMELRTGSAMPNIKKSTFEEFEITIDGSTQVQESIVKTLELVTRLIDQRHKQLASLDTLVKARFVGLDDEIGELVLQIARREYPAQSPDFSLKQISL